MISSYDTLPVGKYLDIQAAAEDKALSAIDLQVRVIAILADLPERDVLNAPIAQDREWAAGAEFLNAPAKQAGRPASRYALGSFTLIPTLDLRKLTAAQYIDFQTFAPEGSKRLVELLSVFLVPEGGNYNDGYDVLQVQDAIRDALPMSDALTLAAFFLNKYAALMRTTLISSVRAARKIRNKTKRAQAMAEIEAARKTMLGTLSQLAGDGSPR